MAAEGGSRDTARQIYKHMFEQSADPKVQDMARRRLLQVDSMDQRDVLRRLFVSYRIRNARCPSNWRELAQLLRSIHAPLDASGAPVDPSGAPYVLVADKCEVELGPGSEVPVK
jgi:hypothetical protein